MKARQITAVVAALAAPAAMNIYLVVCLVDTLRAEGAAMAMGDWDFFFTLFIVGPIAVVLSCGGFLLSAYFHEENQRSCRIGFAINGIIPFILYMIFKVMW